MRDLETSRIMLHAAGRDLQALGNMMNREAFPVEVFGFHAHQAVEKSLKAWLSLKGIQYRRTHNLRHLLTLLEQTGEKVDELWWFTNLDGFAVQFRYDIFDMADEQINRDFVARQTGNLYYSVMQLFEEVKPDAK